MARSIFLVSVVAVVASAATTNPLMNCQTLTFSCDEGLTQKNNVEECCIWNGPCGDDIPLCSEEVCCRAENNDGLVSPDAELKDGELSPYLTCEALEFACDEGLIQEGVTDDCCIWNGPCGVDMPMCSEQLCCRATDALNEILTSFPSESAAYSPDGELYEDVYDDLEELLLAFPEESEVYPAYPEASEVY